MVSMHITTSTICLQTLAFIFCAQAYSPKESREEPINYRLPNDTYPEHYDIKLTTNIHKGEKAFQGEIVIDIAVVNETSNIILHARQLHISEITIENSCTGKIEELCYEYELKREFLILKRQNELHFAAGSKWKVTISYSGELRDDNKGFYMSKYKDEAGNYRFLATTHFESTNARHAFPCYDEPAKRANFTITINHNADYKAISNMPVNRAISSPSKTVFLTTDRMPPYIVAFLVSDFEYTENIHEGIPHRAYSRRGVNDETNFALDSSILMIDYFANYSGIGFMLPKMDHAAVPDFSSNGMENWGLAIYPETALLFNENTTVPYMKAFAAKNVAHEIIHQWIGDYVTIQWWNQLWIKEGLATLFSYKTIDNIYPEWNVWQEFHSLEYRGTLEADIGNSSRAMTSYVQEPSEIAGLYGVISYYKASSVLLMWNHALGEAVFQKALSHFLKNHRYSSVTEKDFYSAIETAVEEENLKLPVTASEMLRSWTSQSGYPLLTVKRNYEAGTFSVKQQTFYDDETINDNQTWYIPINYADASRPDFRDTQATHYLLNINEMEFDAEIDKNDWLMLNKQSNGLFCVHYDKENWNLIIASLINEPFKIHVRNRAQLMHDAYRLTMSNRLDHGILFRLLSYLKQENQYIAWSTAINIFASYHRFLKVDPKFKTFVAEQVSPTFEKLGVSDKPGEHHHDKYIRDYIIDIACAVGMVECLEETNRKLKAELVHNDPIEPYLKDTIFRNGLRQSSDNFFDFVFQKLLDSTDEILRIQLIYSLGRSQNVNQIKKFIRSSINETNGLFSHERSTLLDAASSGSMTGLSACIEFLNENFNAYVNLEGNSLENTIRGMAVNILNKEVEENYLALVGRLIERGHISTSLEGDVKKTIENNFVWLETHGEPITLWISQYYEENTN